MLFSETANYVKGDESIKNDNVVHESPIAIITNRYFLHFIENYCQPLERKLHKSGSLMRICMATQCPSIRAATNYTKINFHELSKRGDIIDIRQLTSNEWKISLMK